MSGRRTAALGLASLIACAGCSDASGWIARLSQGSEAAASAETHAELASDDGTQVFVSPEDRLTAPPLDEIIPSSKSRVVRDECVRRGLAHHALEINALHLKAVIRGAHGSPIAMVNDGKHIRQMVRSGDYIGTDCWRVREIGSEDIVLEQPYVDASGKPRSHVVRIGVGESAAENFTAGE